jgi:hypothetical protein
MNRRSRAGLPVQNAAPSTTNPQAFAKKKFRLSLFVIVRELLFGIIWFE